MSDLKKLKDWAKKLPNKKAAALYVEKLEELEGGNKMVTVSGIQMSSEGFIEMLDRCVKNPVKNSLIVKPTLAEKLNLTK